jgi:alanine-synthesizing transaminase
VTSLSGGTPVHYMCDEANGWMPDLDDIRAKITPRTAASSSSTPTTPPARCTRRAAAGIVQLAREHGLVSGRRGLRQGAVRRRQAHGHGQPVDRRADAHLQRLSKAYRSCGYRAGWMVVSGDKRPRATTSRA